MRPLDDVAGGSAELYGPVMPAGDGMISLGLSVQTTDIPLADRIRQEDRRGWHLRSPLERPRTQARLRLRVRRSAR